MALFRWFLNFIPNGLTGPTLGLVLAMLLILTGWKGPAFSGQDQENLIDLFEADGKVVAVCLGRHQITQSLRSGEAVLWMAAQGRVGGVVTSQRLLAVTAGAQVWQTLPLGLDESEACRWFISENLVLVVSQDRAIVFDADAGAFGETRIRIRDRFLAGGADRDVAVAVLSGHALGYMPGMAAFADIRLHRNESLEQLKISQARAVLRTSERLLSFSAGQWRAQPL